MKHIATCGSAVPGLGKEQQQVAQEDCHRLIHVSANEACDEDEDFGTKSMEEECTLEPNNPHAEISYFLANS